MSSPPGKISPDKILLLLSKLRLHTLTKDEAREFLPILEKEVREARVGSKSEYERVVNRLAEILTMYLNESIDLKKISFDVLNELD